MKRFSEEPLNDHNKAQSPRRQDVETSAKWRIAAHRLQIPEMNWSRPSIVQYVAMYRSFQDLQLLANKTRFDRTGNIDNEGHLFAHAPNLANTIYDEGYEPGMRPALSERFRMVESVSSAMVVAMQHGLNSDTSAGDPTAYIRSKLNAAIYPYGLRVMEKPKPGQCPTCGK